MASVTGLVKPIQCCGAPTAVFYKSKNSSHRAHRGHRENPYQGLLFLDTDDTRDALSPSASPRFVGKAGGFRRGLSERAARVPQPPGFSGKLRAVRRTGVVGCPSLWFLSLGQTRERNLPPGNPGLAQLAKCYIARPRLCNYISLISLMNASLARLTDLKLGRLFSITLSIDRKRSDPEREW